MEKIKLVLDTNVIIYYLYGIEPFSGDISLMLKNDLMLLAPENWKSEFLNFTCLMIKNGSITFEDGIQKLNLAELLINNSVSISRLWNKALYFSIKKMHSPFDTVFVALAEQEKIKLATFDAKLIKNFPETALTPA